MPTVNTTFCVPASSSRRRGDAQDACGPWRMSRNSPEPPRDALQSVPCSLTRPRPVGRVHTRWGAGAAFPRSLEAEQVRAFLPAG